MFADRFDPTSSRTKTEGKSLRDANILDNKNLPSYFGFHLHSTPECIEGMGNSLGKGVELGK